MLTQTFTRTVVMGDSATFLSTVCQAVWR